MTFLRSNKSVCNIFQSFRLSTVDHSRIFLGTSTIGRVWLGSSLGCILLHSSFAVSKNFDSFINIRISKFLPTLLA